MTKVTGLVLCAPRPRTPLGLDVFTAVREGSRPQRDGRLNAHSYGKTNGYCGFFFLPNSPVRESIVLPLFPGCSRPLSWPLAIPFMSGLKLGLEVVP